MRFLAAALMAWSAAADEPRRGPVSNLPLPRFVSLARDEANARRGPDVSHRIDWVFRHRGQPLEISAEYGEWLLARDQDGEGGWVHRSLLRGRRMAVFTIDDALLRVDPAPDARPVARAERGALGRLRECRPDWCLVEADGRRGWAAKSALWGARDDEVFE